MTTLPDYTPITGVVLATTDRHVLFNFGHGEDWVEREFIKEESMFPGDLMTWNILTDVLIRMGIIN